VQSIRKILSSAWQALFGDPVRAFGVVSLVCCWRLRLHRQRTLQPVAQLSAHYLALITIAAMQSACVADPAGHSSDLVAELGVVDRCTTCHLGLNEASLGDVKEQPFRKHPVVPHSLDGFGCVICHGGQGPPRRLPRDTTANGRRRTNPATRYIESGCGQCHQNALLGTPQLNLGRTMLTRYGCVHCHAITRPDGTKVAATDHPPSLVTSRTRRRESGFIVG